MIDLKQSKILVTGSTGLVGTSLVNKLHELGVSAIFTPKKSDYDLTKPYQVSKMFLDMKPEIVFDLAVEFGGVEANAKHPGRIFYSNMIMGLNMIEEARKANVLKFIKLGSQCSFPDKCKVPFKEEELWNGYPTLNNAPYGIAKRSLGVMIESYNKEYGFPGVYLMPCNMFGKYDNFHSKASHVIPTLIRRIVEAKEQNLPSINILGDGTAVREFLYTEDAVDAIILAAEKIETSQPLNIGSGELVSIQNLVNIIRKLVGYEGKAIYSNNVEQNGQQFRGNDCTKFNELTGFSPKKKLMDGLIETIQWFMENRNNLRETWYYNE